MVAMLVAGSIGGLYSCQKKPQEAPSPARAPSPVEAVRSAFNAAGHDQALTQAFGDSTQLRWEPDWRAAYTKPGRNGIAYTYVPLAPHAAGYEHWAASRGVSNGRHATLYHCEAGWGIL